MKRAALALLFLCLMTASGTPYALTGYVWLSAVATYCHEASSVPAAHLEQFKAALNTWSAIPGCRFRFYHGGAAPLTPSIGNSVNELKLEDLGPMGAYAITYGLFMGVQLIEADISMSSAINWTTTGNGVDPDFQTVVVHELGHSVGLDHVTDPSSVMESGDPTVVRRSLSADDMAGARAIYPDDGTTPGPTPPPAPTGPDLAVLTVIATPVPRGPGDVIDVTYIVKNRGQTASGPFGVDAYLCPARRPKAGDRWLGRATEPMELAAGASAAGRIEGLTIPGDLLPGYWLAGIIVDVDSTTTDTFPLNNAGSALPGFRVEREPLVISPGDSVRGDIGPYGQDLFEMRLLKGTEISLSGATAGGTTALVLNPKGSTKSVAFTAAAKKSKLVTVIPEDGYYTLMFGTGAEEASTYSLKTRAKASPAAGTAPVPGSGSIDVVIPVYPGSAVKVALLTLDGTPPSVVATGGTFKVSAKGAKASVSGVADGENVRITLTSAGGAASVSWSGTVKPPSKGIAHVR